MDGSMREMVEKSMATLLNEILDGSTKNSGWMLNPDDPGLLGSLDRISASESSVVPPGRSSSTASHVEHLRFSLSLLNAASKGANPFAGADWGAAWKKTEVSESEWAGLKAQLREEADAWRRNSVGIIDAGEMELTGALASIAHLAYHLGAIRQITPDARGPSHRG